MKLLTVILCLVATVAKAQPITNSIEAAKAYSSQVVKHTNQPYVFDHLDTVTYRNRLSCYYTNGASSLMVEFNKYEGNYMPSWITGKYNDLAAHWKATYEPGADLADISQKGGTFVKQGNQKVSFMELRKDEWAIKIVNY